MKKLITVLLSLFIILSISACAKTIEVEFIVQDSSLGKITGKSPLDINGQVPVIESNDYNFYGWVDENGDEVDTSVPFEESIRLYAKLVEVYNVYWVNEGEVLVSQRYEKGEALVKPEMDIPQSNTVHYVFDKWMVNNEKLNEEMIVEKDLKIEATYKYTNERIDIEVNPLVFDKVGKSYWKRSGIIDNMYGIEQLKITSSDTSVAYYYDTHIFPVGVGECTFKIESKSGLIKYLTVIVKGS